MDLGLALLERLEGDVVLSPYGLARALDVDPRRRDGRDARGARRGDRRPSRRSTGIICAQAAWLGDGYAPGPKLTLDTGPLDPDRDQRVVEREDARDDPADPRRASATTRSLAITDAEYLDAKWAHPFEDTRPAPFEGAGEVPMMRVEGALRARRGRDPAAVPRQRPALRRDARRVARVEWRARPGHRRAAALHARPRSLELAEPLIELGLGPAFEPGRDLDELIDGPGDKALEPRAAARPRRRRRGRHARRRHDRRDDARRLDAAATPSTSSSTGPSPGPSSTRRPAHCCSWAACCNPTERSD